MARCVSRLCHSSSTIRRGGGKFFEIEEIGENKLATITAPDNGTATEVLAALLECAEAWVPATRIIGNVRAGDIARVVRSYLSAKEQDAKELGVRMSLPIALDFADNPRPYHTLRAPADTNGELYRALRTLAAAYRSTPTQDLAATVEAFDREHPEIHWHIAKGKITAGEPLYGVIITDVRGNDLGEGESDTSAIDAFNIALADAGIASKQGNAE
ncbi:hypothetical protein [Agrobacterium larrymoorei]|uniref:hypothetical protein n=1 Tax=Agrobacterium larrymoorei TaxID=160699 RepID=UPI0030C232FD